MAATFVGENSGVGISPLVLQGWGGGGGGGGGGERPFSVNMMVAMEHTTICGVSNGWEFHVAFAHGNPTIIVRQLIICRKYAPLYISSAVSVFQVFSGDQLPLERLHVIDLTWLPLYIVRLHGHSTLPSGCAHFRGLVSKFGYEP